MEKLLQEHGVKVTANRLLIAGTLQKAHRPLTMTELENILETIDKSNIFRTLQVFREAHLVHALEDTGDGVRYELCHSHDHEHDDDQHPHFYCEQCHETYCLDYAEVPDIALPEGFEATSANLMIKGTCPHCQKK